MSLQLVGEFCSLLNSIFTLFSSVNSFKSIIQLKRHIEMAPINRPIKEEHKQVAEPAYVEKYLKLKKKQLKRKHNETILDPELNIKREADNETETPVSKKSKKSKK